MSRPKSDENSVLDASTLRAWEEMRDEVLHEIQEGAAVSDALVESTSQLVATFNFRNPMKGPHLHSQVNGTHR